MPQEHVVHPPLRCYVSDCTRHPGRTADTVLTVWQREFAVPDGYLNTVHGFRSFRGGGIETCPEHLMTLLELFRYANERGRV